MNPVDIVLIIGILLSALRGWRVGLLLSLTSLLAVLVAYTAALAYGGQVAAQLAGEDASPGSGSALIGFILVFVLTAFLVYVLGRVLHTIVRATPFGLFDGAAGAVIGAAGSILVLGLVAILLRTHPPHDRIPKLIDESAFGAHVQRSALVLVDAINAGFPATGQLQEVLGVQVDPKARPALVERLSDGADNARARLDSLLKVSKQRLKSD